jgi:hypothetical protein
MAVKPNRQYNMQNMTRMLISAAALYLGLTAAAGAYYVPMRHQGPWCLNITFGTDGTESDCSFASFEDCRPHIFEGNRGFCEENPRWRGPVRVVHYKHKRHY